MFWFPVQNRNVNLGYNIAGREGLTVLFLLIYSLYRKGNTSRAITKIRKSVGKKPVIAALKKNNKEWNRLMPVYITRYRASRYRAPRSLNHELKSVKVSVHKNTSIRQEAFTDIANLSHETIVGKNMDDVKWKYLLFPKLIEDWSYESAVKIPERLTSPSIHAGLLIHKILFQSPDRPKA